MFFFLKQNWFENKKLLKNSKVRFEKILLVIFESMTQPYINDFLAQRHCF